MSDTTNTAPYSVLQARGVGARAGEVLNAGIVLHAPGGPLVAVTQDRVRLRALHPDYAAVHLGTWAEAVEAELRRHAVTLPEPDQQHAMLALVAQPFVASSMGLATLQSSPVATLRELMELLVETPSRTLRPAPVTRKKNTRLSNELRAWFRASRVFSTNVQDVSKGKVVANYPIDPSSDLYADFAVMNGKLNAIETLDLRGVERLTPLLRGDAALRGVTLDEAREKIDGKRLVVVSASDHPAVKPAIQLVRRYADDVLDVATVGGRQRLVDFIAKALHRPDLPELELASGTA